MEVNSLSQNNLGLPTNSSPSSPLIDVRFIGDGKHIHLERLPLIVRRNGVGKLYRSRIETRLKTALLRFIRNRYLTAEEKKKILGKMKEIQEAIQKVMRVNINPA